jgi:CBS domain-containing protein
MFCDTVFNLIERKSSAAAPIVAPTASVASVVALMNRHEVGAVLVANGKGLEGIVTQRDVLRRVVEPGLDAGETAVRDIMTAEPLTVDAADGVERALALMQRAGLDHLPVVEGRAPRGIVTLGELNGWMIEELRGEAHGALMAVKSFGLSNRRR